MEDQFGTSTDQTIDYYEKMADSFVSATIDADMSGLYDRFEKYLNPGCRLLDLGCGSGRDSKYFVGKRYNVVAADPSQAMCEKTKSLVDVPVLLMKAEDLSFQREFDAVWACASLLHVRREHLQDVFRRIGQALRQGGICYCSFKYGENDRMMEGRFFADYTPEQLEKVIHSVGGFEIVEMWVTADVRGEGYAQKWVNVVVRKNIFSVRK